MELRRAQPIYLLIDDGTVTSMTSTLGVLYDEHYDQKDGFLYMKYASQEVFGWEWD